MNSKIKKRLSITTLLVIMSAIILASLLLSNQEVFAATPGYYNGADEQMINDEAAAHALQENMNVIKQVIDKFFNTSQEWAGKLEGSVKNLFVIFFTLEIVMLGITALIKRESLEDIFGNLIMAAVSGGLILVCIVNYAEWSKAIMIGMTEFTGLLDYDSRNVIVSPLDKGFEVFSAIMGKMSFTSPIMSLGYFIGGLMILICFALITIQIIYVKCEAFVAVGASFILLGFGGCSFFRDYVMNLLRYVISVGFKLYVLYVVLGLGFAFIQDLIIIPEYLTYDVLGALLVIALILLALTKALPDVVAGIIQGAHVNTGHHMTNTIVQSAALAGGGVMAGIHGGINTPGAVSGMIGMGKNVASAAQMASEGGTGGVLGTAKTLRDARRLAMDDAGQIPMHRRMSGKLEQMKEMQGADRNAAPNLDYFD
ncbi:MAG: P-type conjugative transfer protein TrbL [Deltaproteobacteria bacterium]|nr:P-type conjugative transfer protein TrbL [Deltaproteobacteria bacterium]